MRVIKYNTLMKRNSQILIFTISLLAGLLLAANIVIHLAAVALITFFIILGVLAIVNKKFIPLVLVTAGLVLGVYRFQTFKNHQTSTSIDHLQGIKVELTGTVSSDPGWDGYGNYVFYLTDIQSGGRKFSDQLKIKTLVSSAKEGYRVKVSGKISPAQGKTSSQISYAKITILSSSQNWLIRLKTTFIKGLETALPRPASQFMLGLLLGQRSNLPKQIQDNLSLIGLSHIVAVSGYNLTILLAFITRFLKLKWKWLSLVSSLWLIIGFVVLTGAPASIVRAGVMTGLFLITRYYGKTLNLLTCLALTAGLTCLYNPTYMTSDLGWQLSFLSLAGIILLSPGLARLLPSKLRLVSEIMAISLAAQLFTFPLIAYKFGQIALIAPLANTLVMPVIPALMLLGLMAGLAGLIFPLLAYGLFAPVNFAVSQLLDLIRYLASLHFAYVKISTIPIWLVSLSYLPPLAFWFIMRRKQSLRDRSLDNVLSYNGYNKSGEESYVGTL